MHRAPGQAKKNAEYWLWGSGIGGIGRLFGGSTGLNPFDRYYGDNLFELYTGVSRKSLAGKKHDRDSGIDDATQGESRRVRSKTEDDGEQVGRAEGDEDMFMLGDDEVELPRDAPSALDDQQIFSAMPWNMSASIRGSSAVPRSGRVGMLGSIGHSTGQQTSVVQRGGRTVSASPLHGRGQAGGLEALRSLDEDNDFGSLGLGDFGMPPGPSSDDVYAEPEGETQAAVRVREALSAEGENFLTFVSEAIAEKGVRVEMEGAEDIHEVLFEDLLPPAENTRMVACQGLMMVLALGTKGLLEVRQHKSFEEIGLSLTKKAQEAQNLAAAAEDIPEEENQGEEAGGQFEEQMATGTTGGDDEDHDSVYSLHDD